MKSCLQTGLNQSRVGLGARLARILTFQPRAFGFKGFKQSVPADCVWATIDKGTAQILLTNFRPTRNHVKFLLKTV